MRGVGGDNFIIILVVYPRGMVSVSSLDFFNLLVLLLSLLVLLLLSPLE